MGILSTEEIRNICSEKVTSFYPLRQSICSIKDSMTCRQLSACVPISQPIAESYGRIQVSLTRTLLEREHIIDGYRRSTS